MGWWGATAGRAEGDGRLGDPSLPSRDRLGNAEILRAARNDNSERVLLI